MNYVDYKYIMLVSGRLDRFKDTGNHAYNFRCVYCGDSQKDKKKSRGYLLYNSKKNSVGYFCHNCGTSQSLSTFIKNTAPDLYGPYKLEKFGEKMGVKAPGFDDSVLKVTSPALIFKDPLGVCSRLSKVPDTLDIVRKYAESRHIPEELYPELYAAANVNLLTQRIDKYKDDEFPEYPVLVIPFFRDDGSYSYIQCRVADRDAPDDFRFITLQLDDKGPKLYGENHVDWDKPVYSLEGPIDAMFIDNGVANAGATTSIGYVSHQVTSRGHALSNVCMLFDNDYTSNKQVLQHVKNAVRSGFSVVLFDSEFEGIKDVNDAVKDHGWSRSDVNTYVRSRTFSGLRAQLELSGIGNR